MNVAENVAEHWNRKSPRYLPRGTVYRVPIDRESIENIIAHVPCVLYFLWFQILIMIYQNTLKIGVRVHPCYTLGSITLYIDYKRDLLVVSESLSPKKILNNLLMPKSPEYKRTVEVAERAHAWFNIAPKCDAIYLEAPIQLLYSYCA